MICFIIKWSTNTNIRFTLENYYQIREHRNFLYHHDEMVHVDNGHLNEIHISRQHLVLLWYHVKNDHEVHQSINFRKKKNKTVIFLLNQFTDDYFTLIDEQLMNNQNKMIILMDYILIVLLLDISNVQQSDNWMNRVKKPMMKI